MRPILTAMLSLVFFSLGAPAAAEPEFIVPALDEPVVDQAGALSPEERRDLSNLLRAVRRDGGTQVAVLIVKGLDGLPIEEASIKVTDQWQLGDRQRDDGVLFMIALGEHKMRIEVGQGLEGSLTDVHAKRILSDTVRPLFQSGKVFQGILAGTVAILQYTDPNLKLDQYLGQPRPRQRTGSGRPSGFPINLILLPLFLIVVLINRFGSGQRTSYWYNPRGSGGSWGSRSSGGWGGGGYSGGGGGFSGGGASGDW